MADFLPTRDGLLLTFAQDFSAKITSNPTSYSFTAAQATLLANAVSAYETSYGLATDPATKTKGTVIDKDLKRALLKATLRSYARQIQANPSVTAQQKTDLGLPVRDAEPSTRPAPNTQPVGSVVGIVNNDVMTQWFDQLTPTRRARPVGYAGLAIYSYVGENPPSDIEQWRHEGLATTSRFTIGFNPGDAGKKITIVARWYSYKGEFGPLSTPITTVIAALAQAA
jgi:hypothetical protein